MNSFTLHESKSHGTPDFPFEYHYVTSAHPRYNMPFHWHKEWEIIHVLEGTFTVHADNVEYILQPGDSLLIRDGSLHGGTPTHCVYECFLFDLHGMYRNSEAVKKYLRPIYRRHLLPDMYYPAGQHPEIHSVVAALSDACRQNLSADTPGHTTCNNHPAPQELLVLGCLSLLFATILQNGLYTSNETATTDHTHKIDLIKTVLEYIEQHYASSIKLEDLADVANMNPKYFCRFFRSITHQTPIDYVNRYRVEKAAQMLYGTGLPVTDICMECGFSDSSNFIKVFRKYKGMTPKQYRKG